MTVGPHRVADETAIDKNPEMGTTKFYPRGLNITWGNDDRYWRINNSITPVAELMQVSWLEVTCSTDNIKPGKTYSVGFNVKLKPDAFGWNGIDVFVMAKVGKAGKFSLMKVSLGNKKTNKMLAIPEKPLKITVPSDITVTASKEHRSIYLGLYEVWSEKWKGGLKIHDAFVDEVV